MRGGPASKPAGGRRGSGYRVPIEQALLMARTVEGWGEAQQDAGEGEMDAVEREVDAAFAAAIRRLADAAVGILRRCDTAPTVQDVK